MVNLETKLYLMDTLKFWYGNKMFLFLIKPPHLLYTLTQKIAVHYKSNNDKLNCFIIIILKQILKQSFLKNKFVRIEIILYLGLVKKFPLGNFFRNIHIL